MNPRDILAAMRGDGLTVELYGSGIKLVGSLQAVARWRGVVAEHKAPLVEVLACEPRNQHFKFVAPGGPYDEEELEERAGIIAEGCLLDQDTALQEARWQLDRAQAWKTFLHNAETILNAPAEQCEALLALYEIEARWRYGAKLAADMGATMRRWVESRGSVH
jgi:hypothetical protein